MTALPLKKRGGSLGYADQKDLNRVFPGKEDGTENRETGLGRLRRNCCRLRITI